MWGLAENNSDFNMHKEHFQATKSVRCNEQILITKPDKGSGVVILSKCDYIKKMASILDDKTKLLNMGDVNLHDNTTFHTLSDVSYSDECRTKKALRMI